MNSAEARALLANYRSGVDDATGLQTAKALEMVRHDPELARWFAREQAVHAALAAKLGELPVPATLKGELLALGNVVQVPQATWRQTWRPALAGAAAAAILTWVAVPVFLRPAAPSAKVTQRLPLQTTPPPAVKIETMKPASLEDFRAEMVSFVRLPPALDYESRDPEKLQDYVDREEGPGNLHLPAGLRELPGKGCRILSFRGHKVALLCFQRKNGQLVHLLAVDKSVLGPFEGSRPNPLVSLEESWATAAWTEGDLVYLVAAKGDNELLDGYLHG